MANSRDQPVGNAEAERDEGQGDEGWYGVADICPVDFGDLADHHATNLGTRS